MFVWLMEPASSTVNSGLRFHQALLAVVVTTPSCEGQPEKLLPLGEKWPHCGLAWHEHPESEEQDVRSCQCYLHIIFKWNLFRFKTNGYCSYFIHSFSWVIISPNAIHVSKHIKSVHSNPASMFFDIIIT